MRRTTESNARGKREETYARVSNRVAISDFSHTHACTQRETYPGGVKRSARNSSTAGQGRAETGKETNRRTTTGGRRRRRRCVREWRRDAGRRRGSRTRRAFRVARRKQWRRRGSPIQRGTEHRPRQAPPPLERPARAIVVRPRSLLRAPRGVARCRAARHNCGLSPPWTVGERDGPPPRHRHGMAPPRYTLCRTGPGREASSGATLPGGKATAWSTPLAQDEGVRKSENRGRKE